MGWYYLWGFRDYDRSLDQFEIVRDQEPNHSEALLGMLEIRLRHLPDGHESFHIGTQFDDGAR